MVVMATDDDIIRDSPYGALVSIESVSAKPEFQRAINLTIVIQDTDTGGNKYFNQCTNVHAGRKAF